MRCSPNNLRQSFQSRILNFVFDLLLLGLTKNEEQVLALERRTSFQTNGTDSIFIAIVSGWSGAKKEFYRVHQEANECQNRVRLLILCNAFYKSGIRAHYDVLEVTWKVAKDICPDEIRDDNQRDSFTIVVWKSLPLESILRELVITDDESLAPKTTKIKTKSI